MFRPMAEVSFPVFVNPANDKEKRRLQAGKSLVIYLLDLLVAIKAFLRIRSNYNGHQSAAKQVNFLLNFF